MRYCVPQNKKVNLITFAYKRDTLKESFLECYRRRVADVKREATNEYVYKDITLEEIETQLIEDLKEFVDDFVFDVAWREGDAEILGKSQTSFYDWISDEEEVFKGQIE